jgi:hypothetical protein
VWNLRGPDSAGGPSSSLRHYVNYQHVAQLSAQYIHDVLVQTDDGGNIANRVRNILRSGRDALISMQHGSSGHNVVGYNLRDDGAGGYWIDVYDNNRPFLASENTNASSHSGREDNSRIHITAGGNWEFGALGWSGGPRSIIITKATDIPVTPTMPTSLAGLITIIFGDAAKAAQVTDSAGRTLINPDGSPNLDKNGVPDSTVFYPTGPAKTVRPIVLLGGTDTYTQTIVGKATGTYDAALMGRGFAAKVEGVQTAKGIQDTLTLIPDRIGVQFATGSASTKAMLRVNARTSDGVPRNAAVRTTTVKGGGETVAFDAERQALTYTHKGAAADYTLTLDSFDASGKATKFVSPTLRIQPGDRAVFRPTDWNRLKDTDVVLDVTDSKGLTKRYVLRSV